MRSSQRLIYGASLVSVVVIVIFGVIMTGGCGDSETEAVVGRRDITAYVTLNGEAVVPAVADANVLPPYEGPVQRVYVTVGQAVREGDVLMELSAPSSEAYYQQARQRLQQARNALAQARATYGGQLESSRRALDQARAEERRVRQSLQSGQTGGDLQSATDRRQMAEQAVIDDEAIVESSLVPYQRQLVYAQQQLQDAQSGRKAAMIRTPISGTVLSVHAKAGQVVDPEKKQPVVHVVNLDALKVYAPADEDVLESLKPGSPAILNFEEVPGEEFTGSIKNIYSKAAGFLRGVEHTAVIDFTNRTGMVKPEMNAVAKVKIGEVEDALAVPADAVHESNGKPAVKIRVNNEWVTRAVETGISDGEYTAIRSGLKDGDVVLANP